MIGLFCTNLRRSIEISARLEADITVRKLNLTINSGLRNHLPLFALAWKSEHVTGGHTSRSALLDNRAGRSCRVSSPTGRSIAISDTTQNPIKLGQIHLKVTRHVGRKNRAGPKRPTGDAEFGKRPPRLHDLPLEKTRTAKQPDSEILERLEAVMMAAARDQRGGGGDKIYTEMRRELIRRGVEVPSLVEKYPSFESFGSYIGKISDRALREMIVTEAFSENQLLPSTPPINSSNWTGLPDARRQAEAIKFLGPRAIIAIDVLLAEHTRRYDNGGPIEPAELQAIDQIKELRAALDELIRAAELELPLSYRANFIKSLGSAAMERFSNNIAADVQALHSTGTALIITALTMAVSNLICGADPETTNILGAAAAGTFATQRLATQKSTCKS